MTTNATALQLIGELIAGVIDTVPDDQVISTVKEIVHNTIDNGYSMPVMAEPTSRRVWHTAYALGFMPARADSFEIEQAIFAAIDEYDLFND